MISKPELFAHFLHSPKIQVNRDAKWEELDAVRQERITNFISNEFIFSKVIDGLDLIDIDDFEGNDEDKYAHYIKAIDAYTKGISELYGEILLNFPEISEAIQNKRMPPNAAHFSQYLLGLRVSPHANWEKLPTAQQDILSEFINSKIISEVASRFNAIEIDNFEGSEEDKYAQYTRAIDTYAKEISSTYGEILLTYPTISEFIENKIDDGIERVWSDVERSFESVSYHHEINSEDKILDARLEQYFHKVENWKQEISKKYGTIFLKHSAIKALIEKIPPFAQGYERKHYVDEIKEKYSGLQEVARIFLSDYLRQDNRFPNKRNFANAMMDTLKFEYPKPGQNFREYVDDCIKKVIAEQKFKVLGWDIGDDHSSSLRETISMIQILESGTVTKQIKNSGSTFLNKDQKNSPVDITQYLAWKDVAVEMLNRYYLKEKNQHTPKCRFARKLGEELEKKAEEMANNNTPFIEYVNACINEVTKDKLTFGWSAGKDLKFFGKDKDKGASVLYNTVDKIRNLYPNDLEAKVHFVK